MLYMLTDHVAHGGKEFKLKFRLNKPPISDKNLSQKIQMAHNSAINTCGK